MERDWNSWDEQPRTIEEHIEKYRENLVKPKEPETPNEEESIDLFAVSLVKVTRREFIIN
jgi:estrogen receptor-binding fragment-associated gene 9 protein